MAPIPKPALSPTAASALALPPGSRPSPHPEFPITALGPRLSSAATSIAARTQAPIELAAHHLLTLAALAAQRLISVRLPTGALRPVSCYFVTLVGAGEGRSSVETAVVARLRDMPEIPAACRRDLFTDPRSPGASDRYRSFRCQSALFAGEADAVVASARIRRSEASSLSALWDGRVEPSVLSGPYHARFSLHLVTTPRDGRAVLTDPRLVDGGLLGRLLVAAPASRIGERVWTSGNDDTPPDLAAVHAHVKTLVLREPTAHVREAGFTDAAASAWVAFAREMECAMREGGALAAIRPLAGRLAEHAARLAAVIAFMEDEAVARLDETALARGIALARFYAAEALRMADLAPVLETTPEATEQLRRWLERTHTGRSVTLRDVCRGGPASARDADVAYRLLRRLERLGVIQPKIASMQGPGAPRRVREPYCRLVKPAPAASQDVA